MVAETRLERARIGLSVEKNLILNHLKLCEKGERGSDFDYMRVAYFCTNVCSYTTMLLREEITTISHFLAPTN